MTSKIVVNNIESDAGISTIFFNSDIGGTGGSLSIGGDLNISGAVTYEDVTNIDSVGVITARSGIHVTGGSVGIGTDIPQGTLDVRGEIRIGGSSTPVLRWRDGSSEYATARISSGGDLFFEVSNTERLRITSAGNAQFTGNIDLGNVSTSSNSNTGSRLETSGQLLLQLSSSIGAGNQNGIAVYYGNTLKTTIKNDGSATFAGAVEVNGPFDYGASSKASSSLSTGAVFVQKLTGDNSSAFAAYQGANTTPVAQIAGNGVATFANTITAGTETGTGTNVYASGSIQGIVSGTQKWYISPTGAAEFAGGVFCNTANGKLYLNQSSVSPIAINTTAGVRKISLNWDGSAEFKSFITSDRTQSSEACFHSRLNGSNTSVIRANGSADFNGIEVVSGTNPALYLRKNGSGGNLVQGRNAGGGEVFKVLQNGNVQNTNDSYSQISDVKLKENIVDAGSQWDDFKAVRFRKYNFKEETGYETHTQLGVIAQELELTSPGLVYETADQDEDGNDLGTTTKAVKSSILTKKALVALQEAMERIETLETQNASLEARLTALEGS